MSPESSPMPVAPAVDMAAIGFREAVSPELAACTTSLARNNGDVMNIYLHFELVNKVVLVVFCIHSDHRCQIATALPLRRS